MNYSQAVDYLYSRLPMYQRTGSVAMRLGLGNIKALCETLGNPHLQFPAIHIAGTNGKGSTAHMLASVFQCAGYKVGLYTSPHLHRFTERIKINGSEVAESFVVEFVERIKDSAKALDPSFFEITVAMAFDYFVREKVDLAVVEVGLGGRLDSTNILIPILSVITNIGMDHTQFLGNTMSAIATEKAGIIKPGVPVVIGTSHAQTRPVFEKAAAAARGPITFADSTWSIDKDRNVIRHSKNRKSFSVSLAQPVPKYQWENMRTAVAAIEEIRAQYPVEDVDIEKGISEFREVTKLEGRWQVLDVAPSVLCDTAHNQDGIREIVQELQGIPHKDLHIVWGMVEDKDTLSLLQLLPESAHFYYCKPNIPRGLDAEELAAIAQKANRPGVSFSTVSEAVHAARSNAHKGDLVFIGGSTFVVAEALQSEAALAQ